MMPATFPKPAPRPPPTPARRGSGEPWVRVGGGDTYWGARVWVHISSSSAVKRAPAPLCGKTPTAPGRWAPAQTAGWRLVCPGLSGWIPPSCPVGVRAIVLFEDLGLSLLVSSPPPHPTLDPPRAALSPLLAALGLGWIVLS